MLIGCFIRGFKSFSKSEFVQLVLDPEEKYTSLLGQNGVGKSAVLESLNFLFHAEEQWNFNKDLGKKDTNYVVGVFALNKEKIRKDFKGQKSILNGIVYMDEILSRISKSSQSMSSDVLLKFRKALNDFPTEKYFLVLAGLDAKREGTFGPINKDMAKELDGKGVDEAEKNKIIDRILDYHEYIYVPAENIPEKLLHLENIKIQRLLKDNVSAEIESILRSSSGGQNKATVIDYINNELTHYLDELNDDLLSNNSDYRFDTRDRKKKILPKDLISQIANAFFNKRRVFNKQNVQIDRLSSGEQKQAIIDIFSALLTKKSQNSNDEDTLIFCIDEPEISQDYMNVYPQFERLEKLARLSGTQVIITTHWYGMLPVIDQGTLTSIYSGGTSQSYSLFNMYDSQRKFKDDYKLKSLYDLVNSIVAIARSESTENIILCEGGTDKLYLESYLDENKVKVIPVGGKGNVVSMFGLLKASFQAIPGDDSSFRIICIIDSDYNGGYNPNLVEHSGEQVKLLRWNINENMDLQLCDVRSNMSNISDVSVEDILDPECFWNVLKEYFDKENSNIFEGIRMNPKFKFSNLIGFRQRLTQSMVMIESIDGQKNIDKIKNSLSQHETKWELAQKYHNTFRLDKNRPNDQYPILKAIESEFNKDLRKEMNSSNKLHGVVHSSKNKDYPFKIVVENERYTISEGSYLYPKQKLRADLVDERQIIENKGITIDVNRNGSVYKKLTKDYTFVGGHGGPNVLIDVLKLILGRNVENIRLYLN